MWNEQSIIHLETMFELKDDYSGTQGIFFVQIMI